MRSWKLFISLIFLVILSGCSGTKLVRNSLTPEMVKEIKKHNNYIKIHLKDGGLVITKNYHVTLTADSINGNGFRYSFNRSEVTGEANPFSLSKDEIALIETNTLRGNLGNLAALSIVGVPSAFLATYCITNPKACFGSCPTFYAPSQSKPALMAEGFSSSISPSLEKTDVDMLYWADEKSKELSLKLTNEALETHVIRRVDLLAFTTGREEKVFAGTDDRFYRTSDIIPPKSCQAREGDCLELVKQMDHLERYSKTSSRNLAKKEEIILSFDNVLPSRLGLLIGSRQTLLTTYLFYQAMAFAGNYYGELAAETEKGNNHLKGRMQKIWDKLGAIEIYIQGKQNHWEKVGEINEMGPIASDIHLLNLPESQNKQIKIKLRMTKGLWRLDYLGLAKITGEETPLRIKPALVLKNDTTDRDACMRLSEEKNPLITFPGDNYELKYRLPGECSYQFFIESRGYYMEWMREEWLAEENLHKVAIALKFPGLFMRMAAPGFKKAEPKMEKIFWESRYVRQ